VIRQPVRHRLWWRLLVWLVAGVVGVGSWFYAKSQLGHKPLYELSLPRSSVEAMGPWLYIVNEKEQFRRLADGEIVADRDRLHSPNFMMIVPGTDSILRSRSVRSRTMQFEVLHPTTGKIDESFAVDFGKSRYSISHSKRYAATITLLPLHPFQYLAATNMGTLFTADLLQFMSAEENIAPVSSIPLVEVIEIATGKVIHRCTLLPPADGINHPVIMDDGEHLLINSFFNSRILGQYLNKNNTTPEQKAIVGKNMPELRLFNCRTGQLVKEWPELKSVGIEHINEDLLIIHDMEREPLQLWAGGGGMRVKPRWQVLNTKTLELIDLKLPYNTSIVYSSPMASGYRLLIEELIIENNSLIKTKYQLQERSLAGELVHSINIARKQHPTVDLVPRQPLVILTEPGFGYHQSMTQIVERIPWAKRFLGFYSVGKLVDMRTDETLMEVNYLDQVMQLPEDGQHLLVHDMHDKQKLQHHLAVYRLPLTPLPWYSTWLPRLLGLVLFLGILYLGLRRKHFRPAVPN
jgi:hypothetical protein